MLAGFPSQGAAFLLFVVFHVVFPCCHASGKPDAAFTLGPKLYTSTFGAPFPTYKQNRRSSSISLLSDKYDGNQLVKKMMKEWWRIPQRLGTLGSPLFSWYALVRWDQFLGRADEPARIALHAKKLRESLISAGPACIKVGGCLHLRIIKLTMAF